MNFLIQETVYAGLFEARSSNHGVQMGGVFSNITINPDYERPLHRVPLRVRVSFNDEHKILMRVDDECLFEVAVASASKSVVFALYRFDGEIPPLICWLLDFHVREGGYFSANMTNLLMRREPTN